MILITGATGIIGRPLIDALSTAGTAIRAVTRTPQQARFPANIEVVAGDPAQPDTIVPFLQDIQALFLHPRAVGDAAGKLLQYAREQGVKRVVVLSAINVDDPLDQQPSRFRGDHNKEVEAAAVGSRLDWISLRATTFAANTLGAWGEQIRAGNIVRGPYATFAEAPIHERDVAEVGAHALLGDDLSGQKLELTGPASLSQAEMVAIIGEVLGRPLRYEAIPPEAAKHAMVARGFPEPFVAALLARYARGEGQRATTTNVVERILGRPALSYAQWVADHAADFGK